MGYPILLFSLSYYFLVIQLTHNCVTGVIMLSARAFNDACRKLDRLYIDHVAKIGLLLVGIWFVVVVSQYITAISYHVGLSTAESYNHACLLAGEIDSLIKSACISFLYILYYFIDEEELSSSIDRIEKMKPQTWYTPYTSIFHVWMVRYFTLSFANMFLAWEIIHYLWLRHK